MHFQSSIHKILSDWFMQMNVHEIFTGDFLIFNMFVTSINGILYC